MFIILVQEAFGVQAREEKRERKKKLKAFCLSTEHKAKWFTWGGHVQSLFLWLRSLLLVEKRSQKQPWSLLSVNKNIILNPGFSFSLMNKQKPVRPPPPPQTSSSPVWKKSLLFPGDDSTSFVLTYFSPFKQTKKKTRRRRNFSVYIYIYIF